MEKWNAYIDGLKDLSPLELLANRLFLNYCISDEEFAGYYKDVLAFIELLIEKDI